MESHGGWFRLFYCSSHEGHEAEKSQIKDSNLYVVSDYGQSNYTSCFIHTSYIHAGLFEPLKVKLTKASAILLSFQ